MLLSKVAQLPCLMELARQHVSHSDTFSLEPNILESAGVTPS